LHSFYELTTLSCPLLSLHAAAVGARAFIEEDNATGELLGCWRTEIGQLGRVLLLRGFESAEDLATERRRALWSADPFYAGSLVTALSMDSYAPFPFLPLFSLDLLAAFMNFAPTSLGRVACRQPSRAGRRRSSRRGSTPVIS
jgi:hypothetical protein